MTTALSLVVTSGGIGRVRGELVELLDLPYEDIGALLRERGSLESAAGAPVRARMPLGELTPRAPLRPRSIWGIGLNYRSKAKLTGRPIPELPILFLKAPSSLAHPGDEMPVPAGVERMDYEGEIALIIGRRASCITEGEAWSHVAAITASNDTTARDVMKSTGNPSLAKSFPSFASLGASVRAIAGEPDLATLTVRTHVNGELRQDDDARGLIFSVPDLLARISRYAVLEPGDIVLTGTPAGTGEDRGETLRPGDIVRVSVAGVLPLENRVIAAPQSEARAVAEGVRA